MFEAFHRPRPGFVRRTAARAATSVAIVAAGCAGGRAREIPISSADLNCHNGPTSYDASTDVSAGEEVSILGRDVVVGSSGEMSVMGPVTVFPDGRIELDTYVEELHHNGTHVVLDLQTSPVNGGEAMRIRVSCDNQ